VVKNFNSSKSNSSEVDGGGGPDNTPDPAKNFNSSKSNSSEVDGGGGPDNTQGTDYNTTRDTTSVSDGDLVGDGGGPGEPAMTKNYNSSKSNTSSISVEDDLVGGGGGGTGVIGSTFGLAKTILMVAVLLTAAGVGFDLYLTYNDAIDLNLEDHVTDADFALNGDKTEINGDIGFNIPEMGMFEKKILAQVHVTVLESSPTTDGYYSFEYTLSSGEQTYEFSLTDLDPVTVAKIDAGEDLELEYTTSITVIYLGVELAPATTDMPARIVTVETA